VSPIISTVLLIMIVIIIAVIILVWSVGFVQEAVEKEIAGNKKRVDDFCRDVKLKSIINGDGTYGFENVGNVPVYGFKLKKTTEGSSEIVEFDVNNGGSVNPGFSVIVENEGVYSDYVELKVIPILLGQKGSGQEPFECPESSAFGI